MKRLLTLAVILVGLTSYGQSPVRRVDSLTNLLATVDPAAVGADGTISYLVGGYYAANDWGDKARELTASSTAGTTNEGTLWRSIKNPSYYWRARDINSPEQDIRNWGAISGMTNDVTPIIQAVINSGAAVVRIPAGSFALRSTLMVTNTVRVVGDHKDRTILRYYGTNYAIQVGSGSTAYTTRGAELENLFVIGWADPPYDGSYAISNAVALIKVDGAVKGTLKKIRLSNALTGVGIWFNRLAWAWDVLDVSTFDVQYGISMQCNAGVGELVDTINIFGGEIAGAEWGIMMGSHTNTLGTRERGIAAINIDSLIEGNREGGVWINQAENVRLSGYWEGTGVGRTEQTFVRLGNEFDTNDWSASGIVIVGNRFATATNAIQIYAANNVLIDGNDYQNLKSTGVGIVFATTNHSSVVIGPNNWARQSSGSQYNVPVTWTDGVGSYQVQARDDAFNKSLWKMSANAVFGDDPLSWATADRLEYFERNLSVNSTNGSVGVLATMLGTTPTNRTRAFLGTDNTNIYFGGKRDSGGLMPIKITSNGSQLMTLDGTQSSHPNRLVIGDTNGYDKLTVHGNAMIGSPTNHGGFNVFDKQLAIISRDQAEDIGVLFYSFDGVTNRSLSFGLDPFSTEAVLRMGYSVGGEFPFKIRSAAGNDIASFVNSGVTIRNGAGLTLGAETITDLTGTGITIVGGALTATATPYTSFWPDLTNALIAGSNVTFAYDTGNETITISSTGGSGGPTNGSAVYLAGTYQSVVDIEDSPEVDFSISGTNLTAAIVPLSLATNKIDSTFYAWVNSKGGSVYANGTLTTNLKSSVSVRLDTTGSESTLSLSNTAVTAGSYTLANITVGADGRISAASNGSASTNSGSVVSVNGAQQGSINLTNSAKITGTLAGTNLSYSIAANSLDTNDITSTFYTWINSKGGGGDVYSSSNNVFTGSSNVFQGLNSNPKLYVFGTNDLGGSVQGGFISSTQYGTSTNNNFEFSTVSNHLGSNVRITASGWLASGTRTNAHIGLNMGGSVGSGFTVKRDSSGHAYWSTRANSMQEGTTRIEASGKMDESAFTLSTSYGGIDLSPSNGVARLTGSTAPSGGSSGEGLEFLYDTDETAYKGSGLGSIIAIDRATGEWGAIRVRATNVAIASAGAASMAASEILVSNTVVRVQASLLVNGTNVMDAIAAKTGTNIFVNNVLIQPAKLTNSATVTWGTNANGDITATAAGGGSGDKTFVGGNPITNANFVSSVNGTVSIASVTNVTYTFTGVGSATNGYLYKSVDVFTNYNSSTYADVFNLLLPGNTLSENGDEIEIFTGGRFINGSGSDSGYTWDFSMDGSTALSGSISEIADDPSDYLAVSFSIRIRRMSSTSVFIMLENIADHYSTSLTTNEIGRLRFYADYPVGDLASDVLLQFSIANLVADPDVGMNLYGLTILKLGSAGGNTVGGNVYTSSNNVFTGSNTFSGALMLGTTNVATALATAGVNTNFLAGQTIAFFSPPQAHAPSNSPASYGTRNAVPIMEFDPTTQEQTRWVINLPVGYTSANATVVLRWTTSATSGNARWGGRFWNLTGVDIDSDSFATAVEVTTACSGTAGTTVVSTLSATGLDSMVGGDTGIIEIYRDTGDAADTIASDLQLISVEVRGE